MYMYVHSTNTHLTASPTPLCVQAAMDIWVMILRFMGDMPEPKLPTSPEKEGLAKKAFGSISKKFYGSKIAEELQQQVSNIMCFHFLHVLILFE